MALLVRTYVLRLNPGWPNAGSFQHRAANLNLRYFGPDNGLYRISGTIKVDGSPDTPVARLVVLFDQISLRPLRSTWSNATTGAYEFIHLPNRKCMVMSFDYTNNFRAVVADQVTPELMT